MGLIDKGMIWMRNKNGFTLVEIIVSLAIIGIIAVAMIPAFAIQIKITSDTKNLTTGVFEAQADIENSIYDLKVALLDPAIDEMAISGVTKVSTSIFGRNVDVYRLNKPFPLNSNKNFLVYISKVLAEKEVRTLLVADGVSIKVSNDVAHRIADLKKSPLPTLQGLYNANTDAKWYANIYKWYLSKEGNPDPVFPDDYTRLTAIPFTQDNVSNLIQYANRYIVFTVTPVDIHGVRGNEVRSSNTVYILGKEWRTGLFAWVDKNEDTSYTEGTDVKVEKSIMWPLLQAFDTGVKFPDPTNPSNLLDPSGGNLYIPMGIDRASGERAGPIDVIGSQLIDWTVDKGIQLATDINVTNNTDVTLNAEDGSVILHQYVAIDEGTKDAIFESDGKARTINYGASIATAYGDINLTTTGRGDILMNEFTSLSAGSDILLRPYGDIGLYKATLTAKGSVTLDSSKGTTFPGNRDILIKNSQINLTGLRDDQVISINSRNKLDIAGSELNGNPSKRGVLNLIGVDGISLQDTGITHLETRLNNTTSFLGGGWDSDSVLLVPNGKTLTIGVGLTSVQNEGQLILNDTGRVNFVGGMEGDLRNPLVLSLAKGASDDKVVISNNYGRTISYADPSTASVSPIDLGSYQNLGSGTTNLEFTIEKRAGLEDVGITCTFDGNDTIRISASGTGPIASYYRLILKDQYAEDVEGSILFSVTAGEGESPVVTVIGSAMPKRTVTFDKNGGNTDPFPLSISVEIGKEIGTMPTPPIRTGYWFNAWTKTASGGDLITSQTLVYNDFTAYAQWSRRLGFANIEIGQYVKVNNILFQKISDTQLLHNGEIGNQNWASAKSTAENFRASSLNGITWVIESGLVDGTLLTNLASNTTYKNGILKRTVNWWGGDYSTRNAYRVNTSGDVGNQRKTNNNRVRPFIRVNTTDLYIVSGTGTAGDPYILGY